jgi:hypothetical protein
MDMKRRILLWALYGLLALFLIGTAAVSAQGGQAKLVIINFVGTEMTFTLDGTPYSVPGTDMAPEGGQLTLALSPGRHTYSAHTPGSEGTNGEVELAAGETQVLGARTERTGPIVSPAGIVLEVPRDKLVLFEASLTLPSPPALPAQPQPQPLQPLPAGLGALVFVNYIGEDLVVNIQNTLYTVPANGRLQINLPPGEVGYSAGAGLSGMNGTAQVRAGTYTGLGFTREIPPEEPDYRLGKPAPTPVPLEMSVFQVLLADESIAEARPTPAQPAPAAEEERPSSVPASQGELRVANYIGETLTFTIKNQTYSVAGGGGKLTLNLEPGEYTFTASTPGAGVNGSLRVTHEKTTQLSATLDVDSGQMRVFVE